MNIFNYIIRIFSSTTGKMAKKMSENNKKKIAKL